MTRMTQDEQWELICKAREDNDILNGWLKAEQKVRNLEDFIDHLRAKIGDLKDGSAISRVMKKYKVFRQAVAIHAKKTLETGRPISEMDTDLWRFLDIEFLDIEVDEQS